MVSGYFSLQFSKCCLRNLLFSYIYMWCIGFYENMSSTHWYQLLLKHCKTFFRLLAFYNCKVHVWELSWRLTILFLYGFEYMINVIRKPRWAQNVKICCFQAYQNNLLEHLLSWHMGLCVFSLHISFVAIMIICVPFYHHHQIRRMHLQPLFRVRPWNSSMCCSCLPVLLRYWMSYASKIMSCVSCCVVKVLDF